MGGIFRAVSTIEMRAAITIAESAMLKIGQYGNCSQSITWPRNKPGSRKIRSIEFPIIPPKTRPKTTAQPFEVIRGEKYKIITRTTKEKIVRKMYYLKEEYNVSQVNGLFQMKAMLNFLKQ